MPFKLPTSKQKIKYSGGTTRKPVPDMKTPLTVELERPEDEIGLINGRTAKSRYEWNMAKALWFYGWDDFMYQLTVVGGRSIRGGLVLDFLVPTVPLWTALAVDGYYWHKKPAKEQLNDQKLVRALRNRGYHVNNKVLHATDKNVITPEAAKLYVYKHFGRA